MQIASRIVFIIRKPPYGGFLFIQLLLFWYIWLTFPKISCKKFDPLLIKSPVSTEPKYFMPRGSPTIWNRSKFPATAIITPIIIAPNLSMFIPPDFFMSFNVSHIDSVINAATMSLFKKMPPDINYTYIYYI
jgi:hypothetical protein